MSAADNGSDGTPVTDTLARRVLLLNRLWQAVNVVTVRRALSLLYTGKAKAIDDDYRSFGWEAWLEASESARDGTPVLRTVSSTVQVPRVVQHLSYDRRPRPNIKFTRANIYLRDRNRCQYCGRRGAPEALNIDHIVPRSRGGRSTWENVVVACVPCNLRKGDRTPEEAGMQVRRPPRRPRWHPAAILGFWNDPPAQWRPFLELS